MTFTQYLDQLPVMVDSQYYCDFIIILPAFTAGRLLHLLTVTCCIFLSAPALCLSHSGVSAADLDSAATDTITAATAAGEK